MKSTVISPTGQKISGVTVQNDYPSEWAEQWQMMTKKVFPTDFISLSVVCLFRVFLFLFWLALGAFLWSVFDLIRRFVDE